MDQKEKDLDEREAINWMLDELDEMIHKKSSYRDFFESLKAQYHKRLSLSPGQVQALTRMYQRFTDL